MIEINTYIWNDDLAITYNQAIPWWSDNIISEDMSISRW